MRETLDYIGETHKARQTGTIGLAVLLAVLGGFIGYQWPDRGAGRTYDLVQVIGEESDVIDYDQSATDCAIKLDAMRRAGLTVFCEVAR